MSDVNPCFLEDIWFEILTNLPVKTLGKCRCVCKSWRSLIVFPSFMAAHRKHYTQNNTNSLILYKESDEQYILYRDLAQLKQGNKLYTSKFPFVVPVHDMTLGFKFKFIGSVNGLLCVSDSVYLRPIDRILLWNPLIQKSIELSKSNFTGEKSVVGFGYDYQRNDHRVVKISYLEINIPLVEIYSVQERTWRTISPNNYMVDNLINNVSPLNCFSNGIIHWFTTQGTQISDSLEKWLLLFDVAEETFSTLELPDEIVKIRSKQFKFGIFEYQGKLSVSHCEHTVWDVDISSQCQIWVKQDYNVGNSWCKIINVGFLFDLYHDGPLQYLGENEELLGFGKESKAELVSYNPKTREIKELGLPMWGFNKFSAYSESLALLDQEIHDLTVDELKRTNGIS